MEVLSKSDTALDLFLGGDEYHALLRPDGMLSVISAEHPEVPATIKTARHHHGAILHIPASVAETIIAGQGKHLMDEVLRRAVARWYSVVPPPGGDGLRVNTYKDRRFSADTT